LATPYFVNSSRGIIFASLGNDFASAAGTEARRLTLEMKAALSKEYLLKNRTQITGNLELSELMKYKI
jgi:hypothetical protein